MIVKVIGGVMLVFYIGVMIFMALFMGLMAQGAVLLILKYFGVEL